MKYSKMLTWLTVAAGMAFSGASTLSAQDSYWERHEDSRHIRRDYDRLEGMRAHIARDRARLNEDIRQGRDRAAARDAADLARDQRALAAQTRDIRQDYRERY
jgi:hypothetical protein